MPFDPFSPSPIAGLPDTSWLTTRQLAAVGSVLSVWAWIDMGLQNLLCRLVKSDTMLSQALTEDLSPDNRIRALKRLIKTWDNAIFEKTEFQKKSLLEAKEIADWLSKNKKRRNELAHWVWMRTDDDTVFGYKHHTMPFVDEKTRPSTSLKVSEIEDFALESGKVVVRLSAAYFSFANLPDWP